MTASRVSVELLNHLSYSGFPRAFYLKMGHTVPRFIYNLKIFFGAEEIKVYGKLAILGFHSATHHSFYSLSANEGNILYHLYL